MEGGAAICDESLREQKEGEGGEDRVFLSLLIPPSVSTAECT